jgi:hypothetical protein
MSPVEKTLVYADDGLIRRRNLELKRSNPRLVAVGILRERVDGRSYRAGSKRLLVCVFGNEESGALWEMEFRSWKDARSAIERRIGEVLAAGQVTLVRWLK